jgi:hypothetical protein
VDIRTLTFSFMGLSFQTWGILQAIARLSAVLGNPSAPTAIRNLATPVSSIWERHTERMLAFTSAPAPGVQVKALEGLAIAAHSIPRTRSPISPPGSPTRMACNPSLLIPGAVALPPACIAALIASSFSEFAKSICAHITHSRRTRISSRAQKNKHRVYREMLPQICDLYPASAGSRPAKNCFSLDG